MDTPSCKGEVGCAWGTFKEGVFWGPFGVVEGEQVLLGISLLGASFFPQAQRKQWKLVETYFRSLI